jgi:23S rRNA pseudouridine2457 synthase
MPLTYILFNKPYGVLSQFTAEAGHRSLAEFGQFPRDVYPVGRLDVDSEGLLLLTNDDHVKHRLTDPKFQHERTYLIQVEGTLDETSLTKLESGVRIEGRKTSPARVRLLPDEPRLPPRPVPIRFRKNIPTSWLELTLREGRNRQVRKMTAAISHPTLRLVRTKIAFLTLENLAPGEFRTLSTTEADRLLKLLGTRPSKEKAPR